MLQPSIQAAPARQSLVRLLSCLSSAWPMSHLVGFALPPPTMVSTSITAQLRQEVLHGRSHWRWQRGPYLLSLPLNSAIACMARFPGSVLMTHMSSFFSGTARGEEDTTRLRQVVLNQFNQLRVPLHTALSCYAQIRSHCLVSNSGCSFNKSRAGQHVNRSRPSAPFFPSVSQHWPVFSPTVHDPSCLGKVPR